MARRRISASAAIPTLSGLADAIEEIRNGLTVRVTVVSNDLARVQRAQEEMRENMSLLVLRTQATEEDMELMRRLVEADKSLRERFHGGRIGQYILTNETGRIIHVDLYGDGNCWTNGVAERPHYTDPEATKKAIAEAKAKAAAEHERVVAAWEAANLPPDLAALRARQREIERQNAGGED